MLQQVTHPVDQEVNWQTVVNVKSDILFFSLNAVGLTSNYFQSTLDLDFQFNTLYYFENNIAYSEEELSKIFNLLAERIGTDPNYLAEYPQRVYRAADALLKFAQTIQARTDLPQLPNNNLNALFQHYLERCMDAFPIVLTSIPIEIIVTGELEKVLREKLKELNQLDQFEEYLQNLTMLSAKDTFFQQDYRGLLEIGQAIQSESELMKTINTSTAEDTLTYLSEHKPDLHHQLLEHHYQFAWINMYGFRRHPFTIDEAIEKLQDLLTKDCQMTLAEINRKQKQAHRRFEETLKDINLPAELEVKVRMLPELVYLRTYRFDIFTLSAYYARSLFAEVAQRINVSIDELIHLTCWEITDLLLQYRKLSEIPLDQRLENHAVVMIDGQFAVVTDVEYLHQLREKESTAATSSITEIQGTPACKGHATGPAKIVLNPTQITKVEKGDIIVAPMTSPDFVIGMLKAAAIVTDHGGMTCHAAIVSRELNIPCVVGTKHATQTFKDDEIVAVDADQGIVRKT